MTAIHIIDRLGGTTKVARALGTTHSAVANWRKRGIPDGAKFRLLKLAAASGVKLSIEQLDHGCATMGRT